MPLEVLAGDRWDSIGGSQDELGNLGPSQSGLEIDIRLHLKIVAFDRVVRVGQALDEPARRALPKGRPARIHCRAHVFDRIGPPRANTCFALSGANAQS